jgi:F0F1-type ATP synthase epsilon subunit
VLAYHAPIVAKLKPGTISMTDSIGKITKFNLKTGGFLEFSGNKATILLDSLELPS